MIERVISGFQSGADIAGIKAAVAFGIPTGGFTPSGFLTEHGPRPEYADLYGAEALPTADYPTRTRANVEMADLTLWFGRNDSAGFGCTINAAKKAGKPFLKVDSTKHTPRAIARYLDREGFKTVNISGNRESKSPGIEAAVYKFLCDVFEITQGEEGRRHLIEDVLPIGGRFSQEERAAIQEYDGGLSREDAERAAGLKGVIWPTS